MKYDQTVCSESLEALPERAIVIFWSRSPPSAYSMTMQSVLVRSSMNASLYETIFGCLWNQEQNISTQTSIFHYVSEKAEAQTSLERRLLLFWSVRNRILWLLIMSILTRLRQGCEPHLEHSVVLFLWVLPFWPVNRVNVAVRNHAKSC